MEVSEVVPIFILVLSASSGRDGFSSLLLGFMTCFDVLCVKAPLLSLSIEGFGYWSPSLPPRLPGSMAATVALSFDGCLLTPGVLLVGQFFNWCRTSVSKLSLLLRTSIYEALQQLSSLSFGIFGYSFKGSLPRLYWRLLDWPIHGPLA
eukprot:Gb_09552 [translate_table: standard]